MDREAERPAPTGVGSGDFHEKAVKVNFVGTWFYYSEWAGLARQERIALPSELAGERTYCAWLRRYCDFLKGLPLHLPSQHKLERFLTVLARKNVAASTQNQAFNAIIFFYKKALGTDTIKQSPPFLPSSYRP